MADGFAVLRAADDRLAGHLADAVADDGWQA